MSEIHSLPESLKQQIQEAAAEMLEGRLPANVNSPALNEAQRVIVEIARQSPELFVLMLLSGSDIEGIEVTETETATEEQVVDEYKGSYRTSLLKPVATTRTITRRVSLNRGERRKL